MASFCVVFFLNTATVEFELARQAFVTAFFIWVLPAQECNTLLTIDCNFVVVLRIKLYPDQALDDLALAQHAYDRPFSLLVEPVPQRNSLHLAYFIFGTNSHDVLAVRTEVHALNTICVWVDKSAHWGGRQRVPDDQHRIVAGIRGNDPPLVVGACRRRDPIAVAL